MNFIKKITLYYLLFFCFNSFSQIKAGDTVPNFYHVRVVPAYKIHDTIYSNSQPPSNFSVPIDLNNDSKIDINLASRYYQSMGAGGPGGNPIYFPVWSSVIEFKNSTRGIIYKVSLNNLDTLKLNDSINNNNNKWTGLNNTGYLCHNINNFTIDSTWKDKNDYYVGLKITDTLNNTTYGWIKLSVINYNEIYLKEYAFQSSNPKDTSINYYNLPIAVENYYLIDELKIFPNPFSSAITINHKLNINQISLHTMDGKLVQNITEINNNTYQLNTLNFENGLYIIKITLSNNSILHKKMIKIF